MKKEKQRKRAGPRTWTDIGKGSSATSKSTDTESRTTVGSDAILTEPSLTQGSANTGTIRLKKDTQQKQASRVVGKASDRTKGYVRRREP